MLPTDDARAIRGFAILLYAQWTNATGTRNNGVATVLWQWCCRAGGERVVLKRC
jgi:hypothetical protein